MNIITEMIIKLKSMDEDQLFELFYEIEDLNIVQTIGIAAYHFIEQHDDYNGYEPESVDWKRIDDKQRYEDINATNESMK